MMIKMILFGLFIGCFAADPQILNFTVEEDSFKIVSFGDTVFDTTSSNLVYTDSAVFFDSVVQVTGCQNLIYDPSTGQDTIVCNSQITIGRYKHTDSATSYQVTKYNEIVWTGSIVFDALDTDGDSLGVLIAIQVENTPPILVDSVWGGKHNF